MNPPTDGDEAFAAMLGVTKARAAKIRQQMGAAPTFDEFDAKLRADAELARRDAVADVDSDDIEDVAGEADPLGALGELVEDRAMRALRGRLAAHRSWANTSDRSARTAPARDGLLKKFEREVDPDGTLDPQERAIRVEHARKAHMLGMSLKAAQARKARRESR